MSKRSRLIGHSITIRSSVGGSPKPGRTVKPELSPVVRSERRQPAWPPANHSLGSAARTRTSGSPSSLRTMFVPSTIETHL